MTDMPAGVKREGPALSLTTGGAPGSLYLPHVGAYAVLGRKPL
jgi:hypothetical protein